jgi:hypothetical protein
MELKGLKHWVGKTVKYRLNVDMTPRGYSDWRYGTVDDYSKRTNEISISGVWYYYKQIIQIEERLSA